MLIWISGIIIYFLIGFFVAGLVCKREGITQEDIRQQGGAIIIFMNVLCWPLHAITAICTYLTLKFKSVFFNVFSIPENSAEKKTKEEEKKTKEEEKKTKEEEKKKKEFAIQKELEPKIKRTDLLDIN